MRCDMEKILIVDDEDNIRTLLRFNLEKEGYTVEEAADGKEALAIIAKNTPSLIVLDLMLPVLDGLTVCKKLKNDVKTAALPIIMLTAKSDEVEKILGLELGADDYMTKPFAPRELIARIRAVLRRSSSAKVTDNSNIININNLTINSNHYAAYLNNKKLELTPKEFELLALLVKNPKQAFSREKLLETIWGYEYYGDTRTVDVHIRHLRAKLAADPTTAEAIETVRGLGYRFNK